MLLPSPIRHLTSPDEEVPQYEESFTNDISQLKSIFFSRSLMNINEPLSTPRNSGFRFSR